MADVNSNDIAGYAAYLKSQGASDSDIQGYTKYLASQHGVEHPKESSWLDTKVPGGTVGGYIRGAIDTLPTVGMIGGGIAGLETGPGAIGTAGLGYAGGKELADTLKNRILGDQATSTNPIDQARRVTGNTLEGAAYEMGGQVAGKGLELAANSPLVSKAADIIPSALKSTAEKSAIKATGATGKQASQFADNAGRELLDRGIVKFGDTQETIAKRAGDAVDQANSQIDSALTKLSKSGVKVDSNDIVSELESRITELKKDPSQAAVAKRLEGEIENIKAAQEANGGNKFDIIAAENTKRGYNKMAGNWMDPEKGQAGKTLYQSYRNAVEQAANAADSDTAQLFKSGKEAYSTLAPIQEAAERKALNSSQSSGIGLKDLAMADIGANLLGPKGIALAAARKAISPRLASMTAVTADQAANALRAIPKFAQMEAENPVAFKAAASELAQKQTPTATLNAAENDQPKKGPAKWANDGFQKVIDHVSDDTISQVLKDNKTSMLSDPKVNRLLVQASDLKSGSKAMDQIVSKIKSQLAKDE